jgi:hypothetical protein
MYSPDFTSVPANPVAFLKVITHHVPYRMIFHRDGIYVLRLEHRRHGRDSASRRERASDRRPRRG